MNESAVRNHALPTPVAVHRPCPPVPMRGIGPYWPVRSLRKAEARAGCRSTPSGLSDPSDPDLERPCGPQRPGQVIRANYFFSASAAGAAGAAAPSAGAAGAAAPSAAGAAASEAGAAGAASAAGAAGGVAAGSVLAASCFAQAVSMSAATSALRASLVFIDRYPERSKSGEKTIRTSLLSFRGSFTERGGKFYRVTARLETAMELCPP